MKILYLTYENVFGTPILQAMALKPLSILSKKYNLKFKITSSVKSHEKDEIYFANKNNFIKNDKIEVKEFEKSLTSKQSIFSFIVDVVPQIIFAVKESKSCDVIHCRGYGGALIGYIASFITSKPFIFDMRGLLPEETVDVGKIKEQSYKFHLLKIVEKILIERANTVITVSEKFKEYILNNFKAKKVINTNNPTDFKMYKKNIIKEDRINFIYSGSNQIWHLPEKTIKLFSQIENKLKNKVYLYFCINNQSGIEELFIKYNVPKSAYEINTVPFSEMPSYYSKSQIAFCLIKESFSKSVCFPVKFSEYIASNHYVICNKNIGDLEEIIEKHKCGLILNDINSKNSVDKIVNYVEQLYKSKKISYSRDYLSFLDWNEDGAKNIFKIYKNLVE